MDANTALVEWLVTEARQLPNIRLILDALIGRLRAAGLPIARLVLSHPTLHPELNAVAYVWAESRPTVAEQPIPHGVENTPLFRNSPTRLIYEGEEFVRRRLEADDSAGFPIYAELKAEGHTDYVAQRLSFTRGRFAALAISTRRPGGFSDAEIELVRRLLPGLAAVLEIHLAWALTGALLDTYLGQGAGARVLTGQVRRGSVETIHAVLWYCDMRGFTSLSDRLPGPYLIAVLNDFFEALAEPVHAHGGEVLKFIGDAMLAVFRIDARTSDAEACETALTAAEVAIQGMKRLNRRRASEAKGPLDFGLALHIGDVMYGNVGAPARLDFTVTGPSVNLAARIEGLSAQLGRQLVLSSAFVARCPGAFTSLGRFALKGIAEPQELFAPA